MIFDGILDGEDLVFFIPDFHQSSVKRGRLPASCRAGDQHHSVWFADIPAEFLDVRFGESDHFQAQGTKFVADGLFVENTDYRILTVNRGHDRNTEVDRPAFVSRLETAVLRYPPLGNIQFRHDFDTRNNRGVMLLRDWRHCFVQRAVNPILDAHFRISGFNVNITRAPLECRKDDGVQQPDDRARLFLRDLLDGDRFLTSVIFTDQVEFEAFGGFIEHALGRLGFFQQILNFRKRGNLDGQRPAEKRGNFVNNDEITRICHCDNQRGPFHAQRNEVVPEHQIGLYRVKQLQVEMNVLEIDELIPVTFRQLLGSGPVQLLFFGDFFHDCADVPILKIGIYSDIRTKATIFTQLITRARINQA